jgi:hypothetical protein
VQGSERGADLDAEVLEQGRTRGIPRHALRDGEVIARHELAGRAMLAGVRGLGLGVFGDVAHKMNNVVAVEIPEGVPGEPPQHGLERGERREHGVLPGVVAHRPDAPDAAVQGSERGGLRARRWRCRGGR